MCVLFRYRSTSSMLFRHTDSQLLPGHDIAIILSICGIPQSARTCDVAHIQVLLLFLAPVPVEPPAHRLRHERFLVHEELVVSALGRRYEIGPKHTEQERGFDDGAKHGRGRECAVEDKTEEGGREQREEFECLEVTSEEKCDVAHTEIALSDEEEAKEKVSDHDDTDPVVEVATGEREGEGPPRDIGVVVEDVKQTE